MTQGTSTKSEPKPTFDAGAVLFDLDGTLIHTAPDLVTAVNNMLTALGDQPYPAERITGWVGNGAARLVKRALTGEFDGEPEPIRFEQGMALFKEHYAKVLCVDSKPYPGVVAALTDLSERGFRLACVTNKPKDFTEPLLDALDLSRFFEIVLSGDSLNEQKPHPLPLQHACRKLGVPPIRTVLVGDSLNDVQAAKSAGMPVVCVRFGYADPAALTKAAPDAMIDAFQELPGLIKRC
ncbi:MAG: phosphoglycolate phosphatase [Gammaproteobacteria bacterium]|nr:phosphoglycolate phosphatase [Gammaproteobacteria bacterium]